MKMLNDSRATGLSPLLSIVLVLLSGLAPTYGGEYEPIVPERIGNTMEIRIKNMAFTSTGTPQAMNSHILIVPVGMRVNWINLDPLVTVNGNGGLMPHGITIADAADNALAASPLLTQKHNSFGFAFDKEGDYSYSCFVHPFMTGRVLVMTMPGVKLAAKPPHSEH